MSTTQSESYSTDTSESTCRFRGKVNDPEFRMLYPSTKTFCHKVREPFPIAPRYQRHCCLTEGHEQCALFTESISEPSDDMIYHPSPARVRSNFFRRLLKRG